MMRVLITGKNGQVASCLRMLAPQMEFEPIFLGRPEVDFEDPMNLESAIIAKKPDFIISAAAYTMVDMAESEPEKARIINSQAPLQIAKAANLLKIPLVHLSTDYVFDGQKPEPYNEEDLPNPISIYGKTKLKGEMNIKSETDNHAILRTSWVYSPYGNNFVKTILRLAQTRDEISVVNDQFGSPTYAFAIARACLNIGERLKNEKSKELRGIFNLTASGETNWAEFAKEIILKWGSTCAVNEIPASQYPTPAKRPMNSRLSGEKLLKIYGNRLPLWQVSLSHCLDNIRRQL